MEICAICLDYVDSKDMTQPYKCNHIFHKNCIQKLCKSNFKKKYNCILCKSRIKYDSNYKNYVFNNMLEDERLFDLESYFSKWPNKSCFHNNHNFMIETIGEWDFQNNITDPNFKFTCMLLQCKKCNISFYV